MRVGIIMAAGFALLLAGCSHSSSDIVKALPPDLARNARVDDITISSVPGNVSPEFKAMLATHLREEMSKCATGTQPLKLEVAITSFSEQDPGMTFLAGSSDKIKGTARLVDAATNQTVGDYDIDHSFGAGGLLGMALLSGAEDKMTDAFAQEVCNQAFGTN